VFEQAEQPGSPLVEWLTAELILGIPAWIVLGIALMAGLLALLSLGRVPISYNVLNLKVRWRTTALTALAFTLVVGLLTAMLAFVTGMSRMTEQSGHPGNVVVLSQGATDETFSDLGFSDLGDIENQPQILTEDGKRLMSRELFLIVNQPIADPRPGQPNRRFLQLRGLDEPAIAGRVHDLALAPGGAWFSEAGVRDWPNPDGSLGVPAVECVVGEGIARELSPTPGAMLQVGDTFRLNDRPWLVVGVLDSAGSTFNSEVWAKRGLIGPMFGKESYSTLVGRTAGPAEAEELAEFYEEGYTKASLNAMTETDYFANLNQYNSVLLAATIFVTAILSVGGVFGVMNTMFAAISQRTRDIGVLRLMGYRRRDIVASFLVEAMLIGLIGGVLGCCVGSIVDGQSATSILAAGGGGGKTVVLTITVSTTVIASGLLLTLVMGFVGGLLPSLNAMRLSALDALR